MKLTSYKIKDLINGLYDGPHATPKPADEGPVFLGIKNITEDGSLDLSDIRHISPSEYPKWTKRVVPQGNDIVFSYEATLHRYAIIPDDFIGCLGRRMALIRPNLEKINTNYLYYYFFTDLWRNEVARYILIGSTVDRIPLTKFPDFEVVLPDLKTQNNIASILSAYDDLIENNQRRIRILEEMAQNLFREWFVHFRYPGHENIPLTDSPLGPIPDGWEICKLKDFGRVITGKTPSTRKPEYYGGDIPFVKTPDMHGNAIIFNAEQKLTQLGAESQSNKYIPSESILVSCIGTIGVVSITACECQTNQQINSLIPYDDWTKIYLYQVCRGLKETLMGLGSTGATMGNVNKGKFEGIDILKPDLKILKKYHAICSPQMALIESLLRINCNLAKSRNLILPKLISGKIDVSEVTMPKEDAA